MPEPDERSLTSEAVRAARALVRIHDGARNTPLTRYSFKATAANLVDRLNALLAHWAEEEAGGAENN